MRTQNDSITADGRFQVRASEARMSAAPTRLANGNRQSVDASQRRWFAK
jgi:hypothetical protein